LRLVTNYFGELLEQMAPLSGYGNDLVQALKSVFDEMAAMVAAPPRAGR